MNRCISKVCRSYKQSGWFKQKNNLIRILGNSQKCSGVWRAKTGGSLNAAQITPEHGSPCPLTLTPDTGHCHHHCCCHCPWEPILLKLPKLPQRGCPQIHLVCGWEHLTNRAQDPRLCPFCEAEAGVFSLHSGVQALFHKVRGAQTVGGSSDGRWE